MCRETVWSRGRRLAFFVFGFLSLTAEYYPVLKAGTPSARDMERRLKVILELCDEKLQTHRMRQGWGRQHYRPRQALLLKDANMFFSSEWLTSHFEFQNVIILTMNPIDWIMGMLATDSPLTAIACPSQRVDGHCDFNALLEQYLNVHLPFISSLSYTAEDQAEIQLVSEVEHQLQSGDSKANVGSTGTYSRLRNWLYFTY